MLNDVLDTNGSMAGCLSSIGAQTIVDNFRISKNSEEKQAMLLRKWLVSTIQLERSHGPEGQILRLFATLIASIQLPSR